MIAPIRFDVARFMASHGYAATVDFGRVPERYRVELRSYLGQGILPGLRLRLLLEDDTAAIGLFRDDLPGLADLSDWMHDGLLASCWGSRDQVQLWAVYAREQHAAECDARWKRLNDRSPEP